MQSRWKLLSLIMTVFRSGRREIGETGKGSSRGERGRSLQVTWMCSCMIIDELIMWDGKSTHLSSIKY